MSDSPDAPSPSAEEKELQQLQIQRLRSEQEREELLRPVLMEQFGIDPDTGELTESGERRQELREVLTERQLSAARGELPVPSAIERDIEEQEEQLHAQLREQFGPGFETASPAIERMEEFRERANLTREQARRGELTTAADLLRQREQAQGQRLSQVAGAAGFGGTDQRLGSILGRMRQNRMDEFGFDVQQHNMRSQNVGGGASTGATIGFAAGGPVGAAIGGVGGAVLGDIFS